MNRLLILRTFFLPVILLASMVGVTGKDTVSVFLKADPNSFLVTTLPADDPRLDVAAELPYDANQAHVWKWLELRQSFEGYVRKSYITKGLTVKPGAPVYFVPGNEDAFLTILGDGANAEVLEAAGDWVKISLEASIPVYFETDTLVSNDLENPEIIAPPTDLPAGNSFEVESAVVQDDRVKDEPKDLGHTPTYPGEPIDRILEGTLMAYKPTFRNPWKAPTYQWEILNRGKRRIAFVDPSNLIVDRPIEAYQNKRVSLSGGVYRINNGRDLVIVVNQITIQ